MAERVLVLGGGLAGVASARELAAQGVDVTLVDRNDYHQFQPLLYQVASSQLPAEDIARPHRTIFREHPKVDVNTADVVAADLAARTLTLDDGRVLTGSHVVVAAGAQPNFFGTPGAQEHAFPLYSVADAERLRLHLRDLLRTALADPASTADGAIDVVVVGGGPTGVEVTGALVELMAQLHRTRGLEPGRVTLVDRGNALLGQFSDQAHHYAHGKLTTGGADIRLGVGVSEVHADRVVLTDGTSIPTRTVVWGGGESGAAILEHAGPTPGRGGRIDVRPDLTVDGYPGVYAVGDAANIPSDDPTRALPQLGSVAQQSGRWAAQNLVRGLHGEPAQPFVYRDKGIMAMIGRNAAVAEVGTRHRHQVEGPFAFAAWLGVHALLLSGVHSRTDAFLTWAWEYFDHEHVAHVEESSTPHRIAWGGDEEDRPHIDTERR
ncbi:NAD(P)/FAD-dependent oxidoreductase [Cellulomonas alba]|uniref:NADH:ubiquinone reductase (non-electrogenic) n=1 Tax=Cellulomonas alba TaxID=3053467 RepID=A0ABT7SH69_9CELL|nr:FAD-dependent oxidoreductase [Cellulomonas alba]MDM7855537.1 FAD-dependent oxidoreductase [Cellulomonas alba]